MPGSATGASAAVARCRPVGSVPAEGVRQGLGVFPQIEVAGAFTIIGLQNFLADRVGSWINVIIGAIFVVCVIAFRKGVVGELIAWQRRRAAK